MKKKWRGPTPYQLRTKSEATPQMGIKKETHSHKKGHTEYFIRTSSVPHPYLIRTTFD